MTTESSNDLVSISIDTLDHVTGGSGPSDKGPDKKGPGKKGQGGSAGSLGEALKGLGSGRSTSSGGTVHNGGGNSDYYY